MCYGVIVNGLGEYRRDFADLARQIAEAVRGLEGYVGVDLILTDKGPLVLEINPRLTTAYAGLRQSIEVNPAAMILDTLETGKMPETEGLPCHAMPVRL